MYLTGLCSKQSKCAHFVTLLFTELQVAYSRYIIEYAQMNQGTVKR